MIAISPASSTPSRWQVAMTTSSSRRRIGYGTASVIRQRGSSPRRSKNSEASSFKVRSSASSRVEMLRAQTWPGSLPEQTQLTVLDFIHCGQGDTNMPTRAGSAADTDAAIAAAAMKHDIASSADRRMSSSARGLDLQAHAATGGDAHGRASGQVGAGHFPVRVGDLHAAAAVDDRLLER